MSNEGNMKNTIESRRVMVRVEARFRVGDRVTVRKG